MLPLLLLIGTRTGSSAGVARGPSVPGRRSLTVLCSLKWSDDGPGESEVNRSLRSTRPTTTSSSSFVLSGQHLLMHTFIHLQVASADLAAWRTSHTHTQTDTHIPTQYDGVMVPAINNLAHEQHDK